MAVAVESLLTPEILKPARYLGNELGAVHKPWEAATVRWALTYPEIYEVGASNLGHIILYSIVNAQPRQLCDRAYLPAPDLATKLRATQTPLFAVESRRSLIDFDILGFSLSYELGATNILEMLDLAGIPLTWQERAGGLGGGGAEGNLLSSIPPAPLPPCPPASSSAPPSPYPLIFAGGQTATSNPEPYADFFDFIALGDGEELLPEIGLVLEEGKAAGLSRVELLLDLAQIPGVYVPQFYDMAADGSVHPNRPDVPDRILRRVATPIPAYSIGLVPYVQTVHDRLTIEIRRGCTRGCRFCQPGMLTRPARDVEPEVVVDAIEAGMRATGYDEFSLLSLSCSDYLALPAVGLEIKNRLKDENITLSLPSQRVDRFDENIANILGGTRRGGLTFAPEAGTQRLRDIVNKGLTNEELFRGVRTAAEQGWDKIKLYFMIGLPGETDLDVLGIAETVRWLQRDCRVQGQRFLNFNITISNFTPKPHTPFQWHSVSTSEFRRKQALLRDAFRSLRGVKINFTDVRISAMEDFVGRGDRRLSPVVRRAWELGAGMDAWWESLDRAFAAWTQAIAEADLTLKYRQVDRGEWNVFPLEAGGQGSGGAGGQELPVDNAADFDFSATAKPRLRPKLVEEAGGLGGRGAGGQEVVDAALGLAESIDPTSSPAAPPPLRPPASYTSPLPWDHLDTGIDKQWLQEDLQKALEAATVPDCSFEGCSHCGVCGVDFGHNIVVPPQPIPVFTGHFVPNQERVQRLRIRMGKLGEMALVSHLDLMRLFDRVIRRASLPISFTGGFHPTPRIVLASALPLGITSSGEIVDFDLTEAIDPEIFRTKLAAQLPPDLPIYDIEVVPASSPSATQILEQAKYLITIEPVTTEPVTIEPVDPTPAPTADQYQQWIATILASDTFWANQTTKSGKTYPVNLRDRLSSLTLDLPTSPPPHLPTSPELPTLRYVGSCRNDGTFLRPEQVVSMLEQVSGQEFQLRQIHRDRLILKTE